MTTPADYRALCAELVAALDEASEAVDRTSDCVNAANQPALWADSLDLIRRQDDLIARARALLAAPEAVGVADEAVEDAAETIYESMRLAHKQPHKGETPKWDRLGNSLMQAEARGCARAVLSRYAHPAPVPVGERLPGVEP